MGCGNRQSQTGCQQHGQSRPGGDGHSKVALTQDIGRDQSLARKRLAEFLRQQQRRHRADPRGSGAGDDGCTERQDAAAIECSNTFEVVICPVRIG